MTSISLEMYEALRAIDVPDRNAKAVAQAINTELRDEVSALNRRIDELRDELRREGVAVRNDIAALRSDMRLFSWMAGASVGLLSAITLKVFFG